LVLPKNKAFVKYIKSESIKKDFLTGVVSEWYEVSYREARSYIETMGVDWAESLLQKRGGKK
jgi:hypothetical protein